MMWLHWFQWIGCGLVGLYLFWYLDIADRVSQFCLCKDRNECRICKYSDKTKVNLLLAGVLVVMGPVSFVPVGIFLIILLGARLWSIQLPVKQDKPIQDRSNPRTQSEPDYLIAARKEIEEITKGITCLTLPEAKTTSSQIVTEGHKLYPTSPSSVGTTS